jgi:hypothetical protein
MRQQVSVREHFRRGSAATILTVALQVPAFRAPHPLSPGAEGPADGSFDAPTLLPFSRVLYEAEDRRALSIVARRSRNAANGSTGVSASGRLAELGSVIHSGISPRVPSDESITKCRLPA